MLNTIVVQGRLTKEPELKKTQSGISVATVTLAVDRDKKNDNGDRICDFIDVVAWRSGAEFLSNYGHKGSVVTAVGRLQIREWQDRDGNKRKSAEINAENVYIAPTAKEEKVEFVEVEDEGDGEVPF